ncbi:PREDICTED: uronyl 2-sulfotransferase-like [Cyphomyrmex costatus]|uniref:Uronyl 2-sulfotransferase n=1 Tax=Cyphomyrmex costatus TaxID=456900 RepID=A0A195D764_9HYME|nr:PREDICTED: uronyl 2-sulfotransferase-like [Cyphomyrmex costatus]KYN08697.1 Uronyl 2-sulfotransferase [Cyphomyrmex costatus]
MRRNHGLLLSLSTCLTIVFVVLNTWSSTELLGSAITNEKRSVLKNQEASRVDDRWITRSQTNRYITPSLAELGKLPYKHKHILMLTRIPGAGGELMVLILQRLQGYNAFKHIRLPPGDNGLLSSSQQELMVEEITSIIRQEAIPLTFDGDVRFLNFSEFGRQGPTFISLVRNPLDLRIWQKYKKREVHYYGVIPYFCGQDPRCMEQNNTWAMEQAKANVIRWYPVVGILDYMEESLNAFAVEFPYFFKGAIRVYDHFRPKEKHPVISSATSRLQVKDTTLRKVLAQEVEFYQWLKSRLLNKTFNNG